MGVAHFLVKWVGFEDDSTTIYFTWDRLQIEAHEDRALVVFDTTMQFPLKCFVATKDKFGVTEWVWLIS